MRCLQKFYFAGALGSLLCSSLATSCKPKSSTTAQAQYSGGGLAEYVYYQCQSSTNAAGQEYRYALSPLNNTSQEISLQLASTTTPLLEFNDLKKTTTDHWKGETGIEVQLTNKKNGSKGVILTDKALSKAIPAENSWCQILCAGPTILTDGQCLWTGISEDSVIGNMIIEFAALGAGSVLRAAFVARSGSALAAQSAETVLASDPTFRSGAELIAKSGTYDEALANLAKSIEHTNPLSGTKMVGRGNCANDAMTQVVSLVLGRWACAIPYPKGQLGYASSQTILSDLRRLVGIRASHTGITNLTEFAQTTLLRELKDGDVAFVFSGAKNAGHATLITRIKGQLVHINNQTWKERFQTVAQWEETWRKSYAQQGATYQVHVISKRLIGFRR